MGLEITEKIPCSFECDCSRKKIEKVLLSAGARELSSMIADGKDITVNCHFCNKDYVFTVPEIQVLYETAVRKGVK